MSASEESNKGLTQRRLKELSGLEQNEMKDGSCWFKEDSYKDCDSSSIERIRHLLSKASKRGTADRGVPDFLWIDQKTNIAIVVECKGSRNRHTPSGVEPDDISGLLSSQKNVEEYATSGALWFAKYLNGDYDVVAVATSGTDESSYRCTTYLVAREDDISGAKLLERETVFPKALSTPESYKNEFDKEFNRLSESEQQTLKNLDTYARACNGYLRKNHISAKDRAGFLAAILLVLTYDEGSISKTAQKVSEGLANDDAIENLDLFDKNLPSTFLEQLKNVWEDDDVPESKRKMLDKYYRGIIGPELMRAPEDSSKKFPKMSSFLASIIVSMYENVYKPLKLNEQQPKIDVMASFYTSFLKFARGDAKDKGIVLTPRHVCDLFMDIAEWALHRKLNENTPVVDICCGTGSFLIAAMNRMDVNIERNGASPETRKNQKSMVRNNCLMGADSEPEMFALSYANMRFHGDGKSHLYCCSSLEKDRTMTTADGKTETPEAGTALIVKKNRVNLDEALKMAVKDGAGEHDVPDVDKPLVGCINPPYSLDANDSSELDFTLSLLDMLQPGGVGIVILPISSACSKGKALRKEIMEKHSLIGCMSMPINLFHDSHVNTSTCIMVWRVGTPQAESTEPLFLGRWADDGFVTIPHRGRTDANGTWARRKMEWLSQLKGFVKDPKKCLNAQIDMKRGSMPAKSVNPEGIRVIGYADDVVPEAYLDTDFDLVTPESFRERLLGYALYCYLNDTGELNEAQ